MCHKLVSLFGVLLGGLLIFAGGCQTTQPAVQQPKPMIPPPPKPDPQKIAQARETLQQVSTVNDQTAENFYQQGLAFEEEGLAREAIPLYLAAVKVKPSFAHLVYTQLGILYRDIGQYDSAQEALSSAIKLNRGSALAYYQLALVWIEKANDENALAALRKAIQINPEMADAHYYAGKILLRSDKTLAAAHLRQYLRLAKDSSRAGEVYDLLDQLPLKGQPIPSHKKLPPQKAVMGQPGAR